MFVVWETVDCLDPDSVTLHPLPWSLLGGHEIQVGLYKIIVQFLFYRLEQSSKPVILPV